MSKSSIWKLKNMMTKKNLISDHVQMTKENAATWTEKKVIKSVKN